jgi:acyl-[acyl carrier protein]--UDP-N-acetylglucosamine O-acyltransferase
MSRQRQLKHTPVTSVRSSTTTLVAAVSALGQTLPPYMIYKGQRLTEELICNGMEGCIKMPHD